MRIFLVVEEWEIGLLWVKGSSEGSNRVDFFDKIGREDVVVVREDESSVEIFVFFISMVCFGYILKLYEGNIMREVENIGERGSIRER